MRGKERHLHATVRAIRLIVLGVVSALPFSILAVQAATLFLGLPSVEMIDEASGVMLGVGIAVGVFGVDLLLDRSRSAVATFGWAVALIFAWPLALILYWLEVLKPTPWVPLGKPRFLVKEKLESALDVLHDMDVPEWRIGSQGYALAWKIGLLIPPSCLASMRQRFKIEGLSIAVIAGILNMAVQIFGRDALSDPQSIVDFWVIFNPVMGSLVGGILLLIDAPLHHAFRREHELPTWEEFRA